MFLPQETIELNTREMAEKGGEEVNWEEHSVSGTHFIAWAFLT